MGFDSVWTIVGSSIVTGVGLLTLPVDGGAAITMGVVGLMTGLEQRSQEKQQEQERIENLKETQDKLLQAQKVTEKQAQIIQSESEQRLQAQLDTQRVKLDADRESFNYKLAILAGAAISIGTFFVIKNIYNKHLAEEERLRKKAETDREEAEYRALELEDRITCVVCQDEEKSVVFVPCKHMLCCKSCSENLLNQRTGGPLCRSRKEELAYQKLN